MPGRRCFQCFVTARANGVPGLLEKNADAPQLAENEVAPAPCKGDINVGVTRRVGSRVLQAIGRLGKQRASGGFTDEVGQISAPKSVAKLVSVPLETIKQGASWAIKGIYEHQVVHIGMRCLDETLSGGGLLEFPRGKGALLKERLFHDLLTGARDFQSLPSSDVSAAQPDLRRLTLVQAVRLRVLVMSNFGGNCSSGSHASFIQSLEAQVCEKLGDRLCGNKLRVNKSDKSELAKLGREALLMIAVGGVMTASDWFCWWPPLSLGEQRIYINVKSLSASSKFPSGGVLEFSNYSKPDFNDASGKCIWMDWQLKLQRQISGLCTEAPRRHNGCLGALVSEDVLQAGRDRLRSSDRQN